MPTPEAEGRGAALPEPWEPREGKAVPPKEKGKEPSEKREQQAPGHL